MAYRVKTPWLLRNLLYRRLVWRMPQEDVPTVYLTFDDGPHPTATPFILEQLKKHNAYASFFCIGKNVDLYPEIYQQVQDEGHTIGNHTFNHLNGWFTRKDKYIDNIAQAEQVINSNLFRPPYGKITHGQASALLFARKPWTIYMWDVLSGDFDTSLAPEKCLENVISNIEPGSIVVFHDSDKAWERMSYTLPKVLEYCSDKNWKLKGLPVT